MTDWEIWEAKFPAREVDEVGPPAEGPFTDRWQAEALRDYLETTEERAYEVVLLRFQNVYYVEAKL